MPTLREQAGVLKEERRALVAKARKVIETAEAEKRAMRSDEESSYDAMMREVDGLKSRIDKLERTADEEDEGKEDEGREEEDGGKEEEDREEEEEAKDEDDSERGRWITVGKKRFWATPSKPRRSRTRTGTTGAVEMRRQPWESARDFEARKRRSSPEYRQVFNHFLVDGESALRSPLAARAIQADSDIVGGYLTAPQEFVGELIKFVDNLLFIRQKATKYTVRAAQSLGAPSLDQDISDADWTSELDTGNEDNSLQFGKRELTPRPLAKRIKVSNRLLRMATLTGGFSADNSVAGGGPEGLVRARLGYKFAVTEEKAFLNGNGANQPLGLFVASARGISTARDVLTGSATGLTYDGCILAKYSLKQQYWQETEWLFHRDAVSQLARLKDGIGNYIWVPGGKGGPGDTLLDRPVNMSEYAPNTFTTGLYAGMLFAPRFYWICDSETMQIQRLVELYAAANQTGFIARMELDGMPVLEEAFARLKMN
jgi:HK97 family phage major capsid protein